MKENYMYRKYNESNSERARYMPENQNMKMENIPAKKLTGQMTSPMLTMEIMMESPMLKEMMPIKISGRC